MSDSGRATSQLLATLQSRKDTLEAKLHDKTQELKLLCIKEAELTGVLPPEIPLDPGESPPQFRRRVGTAFSIPENLINNNNVKTKEEETLAALELEYKIQKDIADAALGMANDSCLTKAVRRKHRQVYQKIQRRLAELEVRLLHLQQNLGHSNKLQQLKQRKKPRPRPPLDNETDNSEPDPIFHDEGISLSPIGPDCENRSNFKEQQEQQQQQHQNDVAVRGIWHSASYNGLFAPQHRHMTSGYHHHHHHHHHHPHVQQYSALPVDVGYTVQRERLDQGRSIPGYWLRYETNFENLPYSTVQRPLHMHQMYSSRTKPAVDVETADRFGSLDRGSTQVNTRSSSSPCLEAYGIEDLNSEMRKITFSNVNCNYYLPGHEQRLGSRRYLPPPPPPPPPGGGALLPSQMYPEHSLGGAGGQGGVGSQALSRTQSLGSVGSESRGVKEHPSLREITDPLNRKQKEKEWYETSLDSAPVVGPSAPLSPACVPPAPSAPAPSAPAPSAPSAPSQGLCLPLRRPSSHSLSGQEGHQKNCPAFAEVMQNDLFSDISSDLSRSSSNISIEQRTNYPALQALGQKVISAENFDTVVPLESPKNHMVVEAGKWQPYREVTKPFEMADFYKYSTKFRKQTGTAHTAPRFPTASLDAYSPRSSPSPTPQQKAVYQPLQPMTCQPVDLSATAATHNRGRTGGEEGERGEADAAGGGQRKAKAAEMLEWYQDRDRTVPRSATLV